MTAVLVAAVLTVGPVTVEPRPLPPVLTYASRCVEHPTCIVQVSAVAPASVGPQPSPPTTAPPPAETIPPPSTPTATQPPGSGSGVESWAGLVASVWPADQVATALCVISLESGGDPAAQNPSGASGLFQVMPFWAPEFGYTPADLFDPTINVTVAYQVWRQQGWGAWSVIGGCQ